jgi:hypothetical protein
MATLRQERDEVQNNANIVFVKMGESLKKRLIFHRMIIFDRPLMVIISITCKMNNIEIFQE